MSSYVHDAWIADDDWFEMRVASFYDIEAEIELIKEPLYELLDSLTLRAGLRAISTGMLVMEFFDAIYMKAQLDF